MKKLIALSLLLIIILSLCLVGCTGEARRIKFEKIDKAELDSMSLETTSKDKMTLIENNHTDYNIYIESDNVKFIQNSVSELIKVVSDMSDITLNIIENNNSPHAIRLIKKDEKGIENDGFIIDISENNIDIISTNDMGLRNGVYHFMEHYLGVIFASPTYTYIPHHKSIYLPIERKIFNPATPWRDVYSIELSQNKWAEKLKINAIDTLTPDNEVFNAPEGMSKEDRARFINEGRQYDGWGTWCHSMYRFLSPEDYFDEHPEYFSMKDGKRIHTYKDRDAHLCLSNENVYKIVRDNLAKKIAEHPEVKYWDFSINDNSWVAGCECDECKRLDREAGGTGMGTLLPFINRLADEFPNVYICTLAYFHTLKPPTNIVCRDNVVIKLCSMLGDQASSYREPTNKNARIFHDRVVEWSKICKHIVIWDYVVNFSHLLLPFPNLAVQVENQKFYEEHNIEGIFHQASREVGGELVHLRAYILSKLMWEGSDMDLAHEVSRYAYAYYGEAGADVIDYLNAIHDNLANSSGTLGLYDEPKAHQRGYISPHNIENYETIIERAKAKVKDDEARLYHLEEIEINIEYAKMLLPRISTEERNKAKSRVTELCKKHNIVMAQEWQSLDEFLKSIK